MYTTTCLRDCLTDTGPPKLDSAEFTNRSVYKIHTYIFPYNYFSSFSSPHTLATSSSSSLHDFSFHKIKIIRSEFAYMLFMFKTIFNWIILFMALYFTFLLIFRVYNFIFIFIPHFTFYFIFFAKKKSHNDKSFVKRGYT